VLVTSQLEEHVRLAGADEPAGSVAIALEGLQVGNFYLSITATATSDVERLEGVCKSSRHFNSKIRGIRHGDVVVHLLSSNSSISLQTAIPNAGKNLPPKVSSFFSCFFFFEY
jgi:hypothetical protein